MPDRDVLAQFASQLLEIATEMRETSSTRRAREARDAVVGGERPIHVAQALLAQRRARRQFLPPSLFHEPAWEILLSLFVAHEQGRTLNVKDLVQLIDAPVTTSQRWIDQLAHMKLVNRVADAADRRRLEITLTEDAAERMSQYLSSLTADPVRS